MIAETVAEKISRIREQFQSTRLDIGDRSKTEVVDEFTNFNKFDNDFHDFHQNFDNWANSTE